jgi:hypothetical protein
MPSVSSVHEEVHADAERQEPDQASIPGEDVNAMLVGQQQAGDGEENYQDEAGARLPETSGRRRLVSRVIMIAHIVLRIDGQAASEAARALETSCRNRFLQGRDGVH